MTVKSSILSIYCLRIIALWAITHGILTCVDGLNRWHSPEFDFVKLMPGSPYTWGTVFILSGLTILVASFLGPRFSKTLFNGRINITYAKIKNTGLYTIAGACLLFATGVIIASQVYLTISLSVGTRDFLIAALCVLMTKSMEPENVPLKPRQIL